MKDNRTRRALALLLTLALCLCAPMAQAETAQATAESEALPAEQAEVQAEVRIEVETAGNSSVSYPVVSGLADESIQGRLNAAIETGLSLANARLLLERVRAAYDCPSCFDLLMHGRKALHSPSTSLQHKTNRAGVFFPQPARFFLPVF